MTVTNLNESLIDASFKDESPVRTVEKIKGILAEYNIKTTEIWSDSGVEHCLSLRLNVDGTNFGVNGKGLTKEFALASAYGELMERMQLGLFSDSSVQKIGHYSQVVGEDEMIPKEQLYEELPNWYDFLAKKVTELDKVDRRGMDILSQYANSQGQIASASFYSLMKGKRVHIPRELRAIVCGSNGGAAGNTMEEALVQAISEIVERHHKQRIVRECISLPDIPEKVLQKYTTAYGIITKLRESGFNVIVKDCSLGTQFPVVCVCYIHKDTGRYHTHFGAYPILEIALERTLTESFQGRNISGFAKNNDFIYTSKDLSSYRSIYQELKKGNYDKSPDFFIGECKYPYNASVGFSGKNNAELLSQLIEFFKEQGREILVYNSSCLGFPTYSVLIPEYSEVFFHGLSAKLNSFVNSKSATRALRNPAAAGFDDYLLLLMHIAEMKKLSDIDERLFSFSTCANLAFPRKHKDDPYLMSAALAYVYYAMDNINQAHSCASKLISLAKEEDTEYLLCVKRYLAMRLNNHSEEKIKELLCFFHKENTVSALYSCIEGGQNPFERFVLRCDEESCENCIAKEYCMQKYTLSLINIIRSKAKELNFDEFAKKLSKFCIN